MNDIFTLHKNEYGAEPEAVASAPGVINLLGEHTDFSEGYVLQAALKQNASVAISTRKDNSLRFYAADLGERKRTTVANLKYKREDRWANYLKGVLFEFLQIGYGFKGLSLTVTGDVPQGIGLGSSAAMGIAAGLALRELFSFSIEDRQIVQTAYLSETAFIGNYERLTDQLNSFYARKGYALFLDTRSLHFSHVPLRMKEAKILVTISNVPQAAAKEEVREREKECEKALASLGEKKSLNGLRDISVQDLKIEMSALSESARRLCLHVLQENKRVIEGKNALEHDDLAQFGKLLSRSHESLRDNFEVSCPELDWLVKRAVELDGCYGSRMAGPGFGGCTITLIQERAVPKYLERLEEYERIFGFKPEYFFLEPSRGAELLYPLKK